MNETLVKQEQKPVAAQETVNGNKALMRSAGLQQPLTMNELKFFGSMIHQAGLIPKAAGETERQLEARAMAKIIAGHAYGFDPVLSMRTFDVINGKLQPTSECTSILIKRSGKYNYKVVEWTHKICTLRFYQRSGDGTWNALGASTFTIEDAQKAGYTTGPNKYNWEKIPRNMLLARAITNGRRLFCADVMDPTGYFGQSGEEVVESTQIPDDLEFAEPQQLQSGAEEAPVTEAVEVEADPVIDEGNEPLDLDSATEDLRNDVQDLIADLPARRQKDILAGKPLVAVMSKDELLAVKAEIEK